MIWRQRGAAPNQEREVTWTLRLLIGMITGTKP